MKCKWTRKRKEKGVDETPPHDYFMHIMLQSERLAAFFYHLGCILQKYRPLKRKTFFNFLLSISLSTAHSKKYLTALIWGGFAFGLSSLEELLDTQMHYVVSSFQKGGKKLVCMG